MEKYLCKLLSNKKVFKKKNKTFFLNMFQQYLDYIFEVNKTNRLSKLFDTAYNFNVKKQLLKFIQKTSNYKRNLVNVKPNPIY